MMRFQPTAACRQQTLGANTAASRGQSLTPSASQGTWQDLGATTFDWHFLIATVTHSGADTLVDLGVKTGTDYAVLVEDLRNSHVNTQASPNLAALPLYVPAGTTLAARAQGSGSVYFTVQGFSRGLLGMPGWPRCHRLYAPGSNRGQVVTPSTGGKGTWAVLTASTAGPIRALSICLDQSGDVTRSTSSFLIDVGVGASGNEQVIIADLFSSSEANLDHHMPNAFGPLPVDIPTGSRVVARAKGTVTDSIGFNMWGVGP